MESSAQLEPGDECTIDLAGQRAISGLILSRQTCYDAHSRGVQLQGTNQTWPFATSSVIHETNNFDGKTLKEIAEAILKPIGAEHYFDGTPPKTVFQYCHTEAGETNFQLLERLARNVKVIITSDKDGKFVFVCPDRSSKKNQGKLIEGQNILKMQCVVSVEQTFKKFIVHGQTNGTNNLRYRKASEQKEEGDGISPRSKRLKYRSRLIAMEQPGADEDHVKTRLDNEQMWSAGTELNATVVVYGWQPDGSGDLWEPGSAVTVHSPMAMLVNQKMMLQSVTYTQDNNSGTTTTLVCVSENVLNGPKQNFAVTSPGPATQPTVGLSLGQGMPRS